MLAVRRAVMRNEGTEKSALKVVFVGQIPISVLPVHAFLNECCALVLLRGQQTQGGEFCSRTGIFMTAWYCLG